MSPAEVRHERLLNGEPAYSIRDLPLLTQEQAEQRLTYGPCPLSRDTFHTWSTCVHPPLRGITFSHAACVYCHTEY